MITAESSKEEVGNYLVETLKLKGEIKDIIIKEDISGDILLEITDEEYKSIGIKPVQFRKIKGLLDKIKDKFGEKHYTEVISIYSNSNDVSEFFKKSLNFEGDLNNLDGKSLLELSDEAIKNLGLNLGQRKKLIKYISYFKTLKVEPPKEPTINKESSLEEVVSYLTKKLKISEEGINSIKEDLGVEGGESLIFLEESDIKFKFNPNIKMKINANKVVVYNGLVIPRSKLFLDKLIKYIIDDICQNYLKNEDSLRKKYTSQEKIIEKTKSYYNTSERLIENVKTEINKNELIKEILYQNNQDLKKLIFDEYLKYYASKYLEKKNTNYMNNEKVLNFLKLIIKIKLSENNDYNYNIQINIEEFIKIIIFTQGYNEDIKILLDTYIEILNYCDNIDEYIINVLKEDILKFEISERNPKYTKIVNNNFFIIIEAFLREYYYLV